METILKPRKDLILTQSDLIDLYNISRKLYAIVRIEQVVANNLIIKLSKIAIFSSLSQSNCTNSYP